MAFPGFTPADFKVFDIDGFTPRMEAIRTRIRPKLEAIGRDLLPDVGRIAGDQAFAHVAKHARRTVNPPDDTWVAFALDKRGYKKHCHFKIAVSRGAVRFLFEAGPEHAGKKRWVSSWKRQGPKLAPVLADLSSDEVTRLGEELVRTRDGQVVLGRAVSAQEAAHWKPRDYARAARETFQLLAPLYRLT